MAQNEFKILIISNLYPSPKHPFFGSFVKNFEDQLINDNRVEYVKGIYIKGIRTNTIKKIFDYLFFYLKIIYYSAFFRYDLIYVHLISHSTLPLRLVNCFKKLPLIFNIHGEDLLVTTNLAKWLLTHSLPLIKKAKYIVVPSHFFKSITENILSDYPKEKIIISASGGIKESFSPGEFNVPNNNNLRIGYVSRIDRGKGWDVLLDALSKLKNEEINLDVNIVGGGPQEDLLIDKIKRLNLSNVNYIGPIAHDKLPSFYQSIDLFVFPTKLRESLGLVGLEAMACGVPVIGSKIGGLTDYIKDGKNGFFFDVDNSNDLARKIRHFYSLTSERKLLMRKEAILTADQYKEDKVASLLFDRILS